MTDRPGSSASGRQDEADGDISVTALYTSGVWRWARLPGSELLASAAATWTFRLVDLVLFVAGLLRRLPSLRHGLVQRHRMLDALVRESGCSRVLEPACGFSPRGAVLSAEGLTYCEVDLPKVVQLKRSLLERTEAGRAVLARPQHRLLAGDVAQLDLEGLFPGEDATFVLTEGLLMYLEADAQRALWRRVADFVRRRPGSSYAFDLVPAAEQPAPGLVGRTLGALMRRFTGGRGFAVDARGRADILRELEEAGFASARCLEPADADPAWRLPFLDRRTQILLFLCR